MLWRATCERRRGRTGVLLPFFAPLKQGAGRFFVPSNGRGEPAMPAPSRKSSDLEVAFDTYWRIMAGPDLVPEHRFDAQRRWRLDRAHLVARVAIELDGGTWGKRDKDGERQPGRHTTGSGYARDCEKLNAATAQGWAVFRLTSDMLRDAPAQHLAPILATITKRLNGEAS